MRLPPFFGQGALTTNHAAGMLSLPTWKEEEGVWGRERPSERQQVQPGERTACTRAMVHLEIQGRQFNASTAPFQAFFPGGRGGELQLYMQPQAGTKAADR